jgi:hypothetical protein
MLGICAVGHDGDGTVAQRGEKPALMVGKGFHSTTPLKCEPLSVEEPDR